MLQNKNALITGSSRGIGLGVARAFAQQGARAVLTSERPRREIPEAEETLALPGTFYIQADLSRDGEAERLVAEAWDQLGTIDILVNNLGSFKEPGFLELTRREFDFLFHINVWMP